MSESEINHRIDRLHGGQFRTTRWSVVQAAGRNDSPSAAEALSVLCESYWYPLYSYLRRRGTKAEEAADLTQGFFARLLDKHDLADADREKGRFRAFLLTALKHYVSNEADRERAEKRGGRQTILSLDVEAAEGRFAIEPADERTPEDEFSRNWAMITMERAMERVREDYRRSNRMELFERLAPCMTHAQETTYRTLAEELDMNETAFKVAVHRVRKRFRECLRREIAETLTDAGEIEEELRDLFEALGS